jgi:hypothetical protein
MAYGSTDGSGTTPWQPSVKYLLVLVVAEIFVMGLVRNFTKHGG